MERIIKPDNHIVPVLTRVRQQNTSELLLEKKSLISTTSVLILLRNGKLYQIVQDAGLQALAYKKLMQDIIREDLDVPSFPKLVEAEPSKISKNQNPPLLSQPQE